MYVGLGKYTIVLVQQYKEAAAVVFFSAKSLVNHPLAGAVHLHMGKEQWLHKTSWNCIEYMTPETLKKTKQ